MTCPVMKNYRGGVTHPCGRDLAPDSDKCSGHSMKHGPSKQERLRAWSAEQPTAATETGGEEEAVDKVRENRLRRAAARQGLSLTKSRRRDPRAYDYGLYWLVKVEGTGWRGRLLVSPELGLSLDEIEACLLGEE